MIVHCTAEGVSILYNPIHKVYSVIHLFTQSVAARLYPKALYLKPSITLHMCVLICSLSVIPSSPGLLTSQPLPISNSMPSIHPVLLVDPYYTSEGGYRKERPITGVRTENKIIW